MADLRTRFERARDVKREELCKVYMRLARKYPQYSRNRVISEVAARCGWSIVGVRDLLKAKGLYQTNVPKGVAVGETLKEVGVI